MAKVKNRRNAGLADRVQNKKKADANKKKLNPFEVHINKEKLKVLGKKSKHDRGLPGVSRAKAIQKRKETLGTEMKLMNKTNAFIDRRIGEKNNQLSAEDRMVARFAAERAKQHSKKSIYNLADEEVLTHRGQTLEEIEKFDDPRSSDDEDEGKRFGGLDNDFVSEGHFGGGVLSKSDSKDGAKSHKDLIEQLIAESKKRKAEKQKEKEQTLDLTEKLDSEWKDLQPVVFKRQKAEEESLIDKLLGKEEKGQDYDKMMRELKFEKRGTPSDALKSKEKQEEEERKKIEELEKQRQERMLPENEIAPSRTKVAPKHRSADDLDDNFVLDNNQDFMLAYDKDGKPLVPEHVLKDYSVPNAKKKFEDGISDTSDDDEDENESGDESDDEENAPETSDDGQISDEDNDSTQNIEQNGLNDDNTEAKSDEDVSENANRVETSDDSESEDEKSLGKTEKNTISKTNKSNEEKVIKNNINSCNDFSNTTDKSKTLKRKPPISDDESETDVEEVLPEERTNDNKNEIKIVMSSKKLKGSLEDSEHESDCDVGKVPELDDSLNLKPHSKLKSIDVLDNKKVENESSDEEDDSESSGDGKNSNFAKLKDLKESDEESENEDVTESIGSFSDFKTAEGDNLEKLLSGKTPSQQSTALQNLIKSYDPSLSENNKELLSRLFAHLLQYVHGLFTNLTEESEIIKSFLIFDKLVPFFYDLIHINKVSTKKFMVELLKEKYCKFKRKPKRVPDLDTLIFFKLVSILYPTSDFRHPVTTPSLIFMTQIITSCRFRDAYSVSRGLFIVSLILEYIVLSKRFVPSALNFLRGIFYLCANTSVLNPVQVVPPFRLHRDPKILILEHDCSKMDVEEKMAANDLAVSEINDSFKIRCFLTSTAMLRELFDNYNDMEALEALFEPHIQLLTRVDLDLYPKKFASTVKDTLQYIKETLEIKTYTQMAREKVRPKALRLYEPDIQDVFTGSKSSKLSKESADNARLKGRYKKEMKGALREIRRDKAYIASVKIRQKIHSDNVRKEKVKQIYKDASIQQGEFNKLKRMK